MKYDDLSFLKISALYKLFTYLLTKAGKLYMRTS